MSSLCNAILTVSLGKGQGRLRVDCPPCRSPIGGIRRGHSDRIIFHYSPLDNGRTLVMREEWAIILVCPRCGTRLNLTLHPEAWAWVRQPTREGREAMLSSAPPWMTRP